MAALITKEQWIAEGMRHMELATWPPDKWAAAIEKGYPPGKRYVYENTHNFMAQQCFWNAAHPAPPPPAPVTSPYQDQARLVVFSAQEPEKGLNASSKYAIAFSADFAYRYPDLANRIKAARDQGHRVAGWCDCRPVGGTPAAVGKAFVEEFKLDYFIGQAESAAEFDDAMSVGAKVIVGNITALRSDQLERIAKDKLGWIQEDYWNEGWGRAESPLITAYCAGIYATVLWDPQIHNYTAAGRWRAGDGIYYSAGVKDWSGLP